MSPAGKLKPVTVIATDTACILIGPNDMRIFLVDMENVPHLTSLSKLAHDDFVILFYTENTPAMKMDTLRNMLDTNALIRCKKVHVGTRNALDFQLSSYMGYLISVYPNASFIIISQDTGYDVVRKFWAEEKGLKIKRQDNIGTKNKN
jgi:hypothetical protein